MIASNSQVQDTWPWRSFVHALLQYSFSFLHEKEVAPSELLKGNRRNTGLASTAPAKSFVQRSSHGSKSGAVILLDAPTKNGLSNYCRFMYRKHQTIGAAAAALSARNPKTAFRQVSKERDRVVGKQSLEFDARRPDSDGIMSACCRDRMM